MARSPRKGSYHHGDLKRALVDASLTLLREDGEEALTVAEIGRRVGVSSAAPYKHFSDRQALLRALAEEGNHLLAQAIAEQVGATRDPVESFRLSGVAYVRWAAENPALFRLMNDPTLLDYTQPPQGVEAPAPLRGTLDTFWADLASLVRSGQALSTQHPVIAQIRGRAVAHGLASYFVSGVFGAMGISTDEAERLFRAVTGEEVSAK